MTAIIAVSGADVSIWQKLEENYGLNSSYTPDAEKREISAIALSSDERYLATLSKETLAPVIKCLDGSEATSVIPVPTADTPFCLAFANTTSRYLAAGSRSGCVYVWDLQKHIIVRKSQPHVTSIIHLTFNQSDKVIATASETGEIILVQTSSSKKGMSLKHELIKTITCLKYCPCKRSYIGACCEEGYLAVWNTISGDILHVFENTHSGPVVSFAFSPINNAFLVSIGTDYTICSYDLKMKKIIQRKKIPHSTKCMDMMNDGRTLAVGTETGEVLLYDMRLSKCLATFQSYRSSVTFVKFSRHIEKCQDNEKKSDVAAVTVMGKNLARSISQFSTPTSGEFTQESMTVSKNGSEFSKVKSSEESTSANRNSIVNTAGSLLSNHDSLKLFSPLQNNNTGSNKSCLHSAVMNSSMNQHSSISHSSTAGVISPLHTNYAGGDNSKEFDSLDVDVDANSAPEAVEKDKNTENSLAGDLLDRVAKLNTDEGTPARVKEVCDKFQEEKRALVADVNSYINDVYYEVLWKMHEKDIQNSETIRALNDEIKMIREEMNLLKKKLQLSNKKGCFSIFEPDL